MARKTKSVEVIAAKERERERAGLPPLHATGNTTPRVKAGTVRAIGAQEKFTAVTTWDGDVAHSKFAIRRSKNDDRYEVNIDFDFSGLTTQHLRDLAMSEVRIRTQARLRSMERRAWPSLTRISVLDDLINSVRQKTGPIDREARMRRDAAALGIPEAAIEQMIKEWKAKMAEEGEVTEEEGEVVADEGEVVDDVDGEISES